MASTIQVKACACGQPYRCIQTDDGWTFFPPSTSKAVKRCVKCKTRLVKSNLLGLQTKPKLADFTGTISDCALPLFTRGADG